MANFQNVFLKNIVCISAAYDYDYDMYDYGGGFADDYYGGYDEPSYYDDYYGNYPLPPPRPRGRGVIPPLTSVILAFYQYCL